MNQRANGSARSRLIFAVLSGLAACTAPEPQAPDAFSASGELIALSGGRSGAANACFTCHGLDGRGDGSGAPRLAGLDIGYLGRQLDDFAIGRRRHPQMQFIARQLSATDRQAVAAFYAATPAPLGGDGNLVAPHPLFHRGDPARGLPPCASCHGIVGEGIGPGFPPLAGQPAPYLAAQLEAWKAGKRRNDPLNIMQRISRRLTEREVRSLAAYAAELPGAAPHRESREAFHAAHHDGPKNGA